MPQPSRRRRYLILVICCMSLVIVGLDNTIVNVALPSIQKELHAPVSGLQWVMDAYTLVLASLLVLAGSTADRVGRRRTFQAGLATFTVGSLLCSLAPSLGWLVVFRIVQAVGGSMLNPVAMSIIVNTFTDRAERARAIGVWGAAVGVSLALGPVVGGLLIAAVGWRGIFWVNIPIGVAAIVLTALFVPESRAPHPRRIDPVGQVLVIVILATLVYGIIEGPRHGWGSPEIIGCFATSAAALVDIPHRRAAARRAADRPAVLPQCPVLRGYPHRGQRVRRAGRVPVPEHALPAGRPRLFGAARWAAHAAAGRGHGDRRADVRADHQLPRPPGAAARRRACA